jgi:hypothetical protein
MCRNLEECDIIVAQSAFGIRVGIRKIHIRWICQQCLILGFLNLPRAY